MNSNTPTPIIIIAYNRPKSLSRLLDSLSKANYPFIDIPLIISIDKGDNNQSVLRIGEDFQWRHGKKTVIYLENNLGLRKHVLQCGNMVLQYGSIIILEDDLYVSPCFYEYSVKALNFSKNKHYIGGVSLYNHQLNVHVKQNFQALDDGYDNWYFQFASSWGQAYTKTQWSDFIAWYKLQGRLEAETTVPKNVTNWSDKSWLKYNIAYLIKENKYFIYPKISLTTNFSDKGTHAGKDSTAYQVSILNRQKQVDFRFSELNESLAVYDAFFENTKLSSVLGLRPSDIIIDLYGYKAQFDRNFVLTSKIFNFKVLKTYGRCLKPLDNNIFRQIEGKDFFLYDTTKVEGNHHKNNRLRKITYNIKFISLIDTAYLLLNKLNNKFLNLIKK